AGATCVDVLPLYIIERRGLGVLTIRADSRAGLSTCGNEGRPEERESGGADGEMDDQDASDTGGPGDSLVPLAKPQEVERGASILSATSCPQDPLWCLRHADTADGVGAT